MTPSLGENLVSSLTIGASVEEIAKVSEWLDHVADEAGWPDRLRFGMELSLEEALANVILYGFPESGRATHEAPAIRVDYLSLPAEQVAVRIVDNGVAFDPTAVAAPDLAESVEEARIGGHGVRLMRHFLQEIAYARIGAENQLTLVASLPAPE